MSSFFLSAPAKVNLFLHIVGKRLDGMHLIESVFVFVKLCDIVEVVTSTGKCEVSFTGCDGIDKNNNTILRTIECFKKYLNIDVKILVRVVKNIMLSSGLGGGSADAASLIKFLGRIYAINSNILNKIAESVGSDVPACLKSRTLFVSGIGEKLYDLSSLSLPKYIVLVNSKVYSMSTAKVFKNYNHNFFSSSIVSELPSINEDNSWFRIIRNSRNDLFNISVKLLPEIRKMISCLEKLDGCLLARMSGSGPTCFALFRCSNKADLAFNFINTNYPNWWVKKTEVIL